jgi:hypothetical protein
VDKINLSMPIKLPPSLYAEYLYGKFRLFLGKYNILCSLIGAVYVDGFLHLYSNHVL